MKYIKWTKTKIKDKTSYWRCKFHRSNWKNVGNGCMLANNLSNDPEIFFLKNIAIYGAIFTDTFLLYLHLTTSLIWEIFHLPLGTRWTCQDWKCLQGQPIRPTCGGNDFRLPLLSLHHPELIANSVPGFTSSSCVYLHSSGSKLKSSVLPLIRSYRIPCLW